MESNPEQFDTSHIEVQEYNPHWVEIFKQEADQIREMVGDKILKIEHIGSTSIPGLASKPIIDIAVEIPSSNNIDAVVESLEKLGYPKSPTHDKDISTERYLLRKGNPTQYHLSICYADKGSFLDRQTLFRDYLRAHDDIRDQYAQLKKDLLQQDPTGKDGYIGGKTDFVMSVLKKAGFQNEWFDLSNY